MSITILIASVALGALGAVLRWLMSQALGAGRAWQAILFVNVVGSAFAGGVSAVPAFEGALPLVAGLCGGLTTFSTLAVQLLPGDHTRRASRLIALGLAHALGGVGACLGAFALVSTLFV
ncbi:MAG: CrcB protein [Pontimonas sp.]|jgi:CrcB protein